MGQKVHPIGIRLGVVKRHNANWYASPKNYADYLLKDLEVRDFLLKKLKAAMVSNLLVVLCGDHNVQPVINTGTLY